MKKDLVDTIMEKEFTELTPAEQAELRDFCATEEEYNQMKDVFIGVETMQFEQPTPRAETKQRLDDLFDQTYPKAAPVWYSSVFAVVVPKEKPLYRQPLMQVAAIGLLFLLMYPFWTTEVAVPTEQHAELAQNERPADKTGAAAKTETVLVADEEPEAPKEPEVIRVKQPVQLATNTPVANHASTRADVAAEPAVDLLNHPDGVFVAYSQPTSETPELLDLLTTTF